MRIRWPVSVGFGCFWLIYRAIGKNRDYRSLGRIQQVTSEGTRKHTYQKRCRKTKQLLHKRHKTGGLQCVLLNKVFQRWRMRIEVIWKNGGEQWRPRDVESLSFHVWVFFVVILGICSWCLLCVYGNAVDRGPNKRRIKPLENNLMQITFGMDSEDDDDSDGDFQVAGETASGKLLAGTKRISFANFFAKGNDVSVSCMLFGVVAIWCTTFC